MHSEPIQLWINPEAGLYCLLDPEDYAWAIQWRWGTVGSRNSSSLYVSRPTRYKGQPIRVYLHKEVLKRSGQLPRSRNHTIGDHINGDTLNNTRANLRWANHNENVRNNKKSRSRKCSKR